MISESYDELDWFWDYLSFQPPMIPYREFRAVTGVESICCELVGIMFSSNALFVMDLSEIAKVSIWVHEFVEIALSGVITEILKLRPLISIPVRLFDERLGWRHADFCHYLAALTTGQGWWDDEYNYCNMEADDVWLWMKSTIKNSLKEDVKIKRGKER
jgi:hypothetical protein